MTDTYKKRVKSAYDELDRKILSDGRFKEELEDIESSVKDTVDHFEQNIDIRDN